MKKILLILFILFGSLTYSQTRYISTSYDFTLLANVLVTDSIRVPWHLVVTAVRVLNITNATTVGVQYSYDATTPSIWYDVLEIGLGTDYAPDMADTSITVFNPSNIAFGQGKNTGGTRGTDWVWIRLKVNASESSTLTLTAMFRYL